MSLFGVPEVRLQKPVQRLLNNPARVWTTVDNQQIQVIAAGIRNPYEGPDYTHIAVLHAGTLYVGSGEFHHYASNWLTHEHTSNPMFGGIVLHIVLENDSPNRYARFTLEISSAELGAELARKPQPLANIASDVTEELQQCALQRLLRTTATAHSTIQRLGTSRALEAFAAEWFTRYAQKRRRPYPFSKLALVHKALPTSTMGEFALGISEMESTTVLERITTLEQHTIGLEGAAVRREIFTNVILPFCCALAEEPQRAVLFQWYWGVEAIHRYGHLERRFPMVAQDYVWQQQGMLEYLREHTNHTTTCAENIARYGFAKTLEFLQCV